MAKYLGKSSPRAENSWTQADVMLEDRGEECEEFPATAPSPPVVGSRPQLLSSEARGHGHASDADIAAQLGGLQSTPADDSPASVTRSPLGWSTATPSTWSHRRRTRQGSQPGRGSPQSCGQRLKADFRGAPGSRRVEIAGVGSGSMRSGRDGRPGDAASSGACLGPVSLTAPYVEPQEPPKDPPSPPH
ncbi:hypothetical protein KIL84_012422 [Mauremys mutica]|uniref:Uncharacterized protein n=1 Tax=Mauremys mutica TaxID=74926 RepID=A0A9D3XUX4_9SAUR|nr:hypothetical protein KIL84_012422 [Mauremys mutica]